MLWGLLPFIMISEIPLKSYKKFFENSEENEALGETSNIFTWGPLKEHPQLKANLPDNSMDGNCLKMMF